MTSTASTASTASPKPFNRPTSLDLSPRPQRNGRMLTNGNCKQSQKGRRAQRLPPKVIETSFSGKRAGSFGSNSSCKRNGRASAEMNGNGVAVVKHSSYVTLSASAREALADEASQDEEDPDSDDEDSLDEKSLDRMIAADQRAAADITEGLAFNVLIGMAIMVVVLGVGSAMLYTVQKILVVSSQRNAARALLNTNAAVASASFTPTAMDSPFLTKLMHHSGAGHVVHPKDLSAYLAMHELRSKRRRVKARTMSTTTSTVAPPQTTERSEGTEVSPPPGSSAEDEYASGAEKVSLAEVSSRKEETEAGSEEEAA